MARQVTDSDTAGILDTPPKYSPRTLRWMSLAPPVLTLTGVASYAMGEEYLYLLFFISAMLIGMVAGAFWPSGRDRKPSEGEMQRRKRATFAGTVVVVVVATSGAAIFSYSDVFGYWKPITQQDWSLIAFLLVLSLTCVQGVCINWARPVGGERED